MREARELGRIGVRGALLLLALAPLAPTLGAAAPPPLGFADLPPRIDPEAGRLYTDAVGLPDPRIERWEARREHARRRAAERGRAALHAHVDAALARALATPRVAAAVHRALEGAVVEVERRPLVDGGAVVRLEVPLEPLRAAAHPLELDL